MHSSVPCRQYSPSSARCCCLCMPVGSSPCADSPETYVGTATAPHTVRCSHQWSCCFACCGSTPAVAKQTKVRGAQPPCNCSWSWCLSNLLRHIMAAQPFGLSPPYERLHHYNVQCNAPAEAPVCSPPACQPCLQRLLLCNIMANA